MFHIFNAIMNVCINKNAIVPKDQNFLFEDVRRNRDAVTYIACISLATHSKLPVQAKQVYHSYTAEG